MKIPNSIEFSWDFQCFKINLKQMKKQIKDLFFQCKQREIPKEFLRFTYVNNLRNFNK